MYSGNPPQIYACATGRFAYIHFSIKREISLSPTSRLASEGVRDRDARVGPPGVPQPALWPPAPATIFFGHPPQIYACDKGRFVNVQLSSKREISFTPTPKLASRGARGHGAGMGRPGDFLTPSPPSRLPGPTKIFFLGRPHQIYARVRWRFAYVHSPSRRSLPEQASPAAPRLARRGARDHGARRGPGGFLYPPYGRLRLL